MAKTTQVVVLAQDQVDRFENRVKELIKYKENVENRLRKAEEYKKNMTNLYEIAITKNTNAH